eukprot:TRINITY_DN3874_c0_g1_i1.p1 TRINITY_DN3874_c0_g1~~TRINITY_DN3874_c0_g1_i1.p1  ORF type:complete len:290 (+),score=53.53 TRINITY_DN3874_c0_g1_i1:64-933(+)
MSSVSECGEYDTTFEYVEDENYVPTEADIHEYAVYLGVDPDREKDLMWIAVEGVGARLPAGWKPCSTQRGQVYYYNTRTGASSWTHPRDVEYKQRLAEERAKRQAVHREWPELPSEVERQAWPSHDPVSAAPAFSAAPVSALPENPVPAVPAFSAAPVSAFPENLVPAVPAYSAAPVSAFPENLDPVTHVRAEPAQAHGGGSAPSQASQVTGGPASLCTKIKVLSSRDQALLAQGRVCPSTTFASVASLLPASVSDRMFVDADGFAYPPPDLVQPHCPAFSDTLTVFVR